MKMGQGVTDGVCIAVSTAGGSGETACSTENVSLVAEQIAERESGSVTPETWGRSGEVQDAIESKADRRSDGEARRSPLPLPFLSDVARRRHLGR